MGFFKCPERLGCIEAVIMANMARRTTASTDFHVGNAATAHT
jgi:hypothetical protein